MSEKWQIDWVGTSERILDVMIRAGVSEPFGVIVYGANCALKTCVCGQCLMSYGEIIPVSYNITFARDVRIDKGIYGRNLFVALSSKTLGERGYQTATNFRKAGVKSVVGVCVSGSHLLRDADFISGRAKPVYCMTKIDPPNTDGLDYLLAVNEESATVL